ncbi:microcin ABC transporter permease, partial [Paracoccus sp. PXZ]
MAAYILRRLLLIIPTLIGIMLVNFTLTQFVPGGPIEQIIARVQGEGDALRNITGGAGEAPQNTEYAGARGIPPELLDQLEVQMGFARIACTPAHQGEPDLKSPDCAKEKIGAAERFLIMLGNYVRFD